MNTTICRIIIGLSMLVAGGAHVDEYLVATSRTLYAAEFYVAPDGSDNNAGTKAKPFATLERARDAVRASREAAAEGAAATVCLRGGNYFLSETFRLDDRDSGVTFRAAAGEEPVVYGGARITGWKKWKENIYRAKVPAGKRFFQLVHGRRAAVMARHPNRGSGYGQNGLSGGYARGWRTVNNTHVGVHGKDRESDFSDAQLFGFIGLDWFSEMREVLSFTGTGLMIDGGSGNFKGLNGRVYVRGVLELLDEPGEWCLKHKEGYVYYWPRDRRQEPGDRGQEKTKYAIGDEDIIVAPCAERIVEVKGRSPETPAEDIRFEGITFVGSDFCARWWLFSFARKDHNSTPEPLQQGLLFGENVRRLTVRGCRILAAGHSGVWLNNWARECTVENCWIEGAGTAGVYMNSYIPGKAPYKTAAEAYINKKHRIVNNFIYDCGLSGCAGSGIQFYQSGENEILHNRIARMPRYGLSHPGIRYGELPATLYGVKKTFENHFEVLHSRNNRIAFNDISNVCRDSSDFGGIQAWGPGRDNVWENNAVHDIDQSVTWDAWSHGLFPDDGSHYHTIRNNIVYEIQGGRATAGVMCKSGGQVVENNIFADNILAWVFTDMPYLEPAFEQVIRRNIVFGPVPKIYGSGKTGRPQIFKEVDRNIFWPRPQQLDALQKGGWEKNAIVADPGFLRKNKPWDTTYEDFRLPPDSPAVKAGFQPIDMDRIGLRDDFPFDRKDMFRKPAWEEIEAEDYDRMHDLKTAGGCGIYHMQPGAWAKYENVDFGDGTLTHIRASMTGKPAVELRLGSPDGRLIGTIAAGTYVAKVEPVKGRQTLFLVFQGSDLQHVLLNDLLDSFVFMPGDLPAEAK